MTTRIYAVGNSEGTRLVRAATQAQALRHVAKSSYDVRVASQNDLVATIGTGAKVEEAGADEAESTACPDQNCAKYRNINGGCDLCVAPCL